MDFPTTLLMFSKFAEADGKYSSGIKTKIQVIFVKSLIDLNIYQQRDLPIDCHDDECQQASDPKHDIVLPIHFYHVIIKVFVLYAAYCRCGFFHVLRVRISEWAP